MTPESWLFVCKIVVLSGSVLAAIAAFGMHHFQSTIDRAKDRKIDSLVQSNARLERELLGQGTYQEDLVPPSGGAGIDVRTNWAFNGVRQGAPDQGAIDVGFGVFLELRRLRKENKSAQIVDLATQQIAKTPEWLTPYLYRGAAHANLGDLEKAAVDLRHVVSAAAGNSDYTKAVELLANVEPRLKTNATRP
jgi:hypothetical protein